MKLIIDIPDYEYTHIKEFYEKNDIAESTYSYIYYGTPLDDVKAEIDEQYDRVHPYNIDVAEGLEMALEILNKYKTESEETHDY